MKSQEGYVNKQARSRTTESPHRDASFPRNITTVPLITQPGSQIIGTSSWSRNRIDHHKAVQILSLRHWPSHQLSAGSFRKHRCSDVPHCHAHTSPWIMDVRPDDMTLLYKFFWLSARCFMTFWKEKVLPNNNTTSTNKLTELNATL